MGNVVSTWRCCALAVLSPRAVPFGKNRLFAQSKGAKAVPEPHARRGFSGRPIGLSAAIARLSEPFLIAPIAF